ncbi:MAG: TonB-dependent receptor, partial [Pseudomonadota bacterium]
VSTGFRAGGFNTFSDFIGQPFEEERAINFEGGVRSTWFDGRLTVNGTGFALFYDDIQVTTPTAVGDSGILVNLIENAAKARTIGTEISLAAEPVPGLALGLDYGLSLTRVREFESAAGDLSGLRLPNAPVHSLALTAEYQHPLPGDIGDAFLRGEFNYTSPASLLPSTLGGALSDSFEFDARTLVNLRLGLRADRYEVELFAENITNDRNFTGITGATTLGPAFGFPAPVETEAGRRFGIRASVYF